MWLLDTNVISETIKSRPERSVIGWLETHAPDDLYLAALTIGELVRGARRLKDTDQRDRLEKWISVDLVRQFDGRVLAFDQYSASLWGQIMGDGDRSGRTRPAADAQIAAVAMQYDLTLVTRNTKDFAEMGVTLFNPWTDTDTVHE